LEEKKFLETARKIIQSTVANTAQKIENEKIINADAKNLGGVVKK
jgi:hypothetical protein